MRILEIVLTLKWKRPPATLAPHCVWCSAGVRINSTLYYTLKDHLGSASVVTDASGVTVGEQRYYPYGETRLTTGTIYTDKLFTGQRELAGLGIYHYNARFYSPKLGRFLSPDTIVQSFANPQTLNRFSYVINNPLRYTDPTGHVVSCDAADKLRKSTNSPLPLPNHPTYQKNLTILHQQLDPAMFAAAWADGQAMTMEQGIAYTLKED